MAEQTYWWTTSATPSGDQQASYTQADLSTIAEILAACSGFEGVAPRYLNELACTDGGANTVDVDTGGAVVDGKPYRNTATINVNIPSAVGGGNTRIDRIVVRATWASFTGAVTRIAGTDAASPTAPAITQSSGVTYDILLCQVLVDTSGNVTVTDERTWASHGMMLIEQKELASDTATVTFANIPQGFNNLLLVISAHGTVSAYQAIYAQFNNDTGSNYAFRVNITDLNGTGSGTSSAGTTQLTLGYLGGTTVSGAWDIARVLLAGYSDTNGFTPVRSEGTGMNDGTATGAYIYEGGGWYLSTDAISEIDLTLGSGSFAQNSVLTLYGIV